MESSKEDIQTVLVLIKRFLPQFTVMKDDLLKLNQNVAINFYSHYIQELANDFHLLLDCSFEDVIGGCPHDVDGEIYLLLFIRDILNKIGVPYLTICDFYRPSNRTRTTMKICLNFLFYIKETIPISQDIVKTYDEYAKEINSRNERVVINKNKVSDMTYKIGLFRERIEELNNEFETETQIENIDSDLVKEIKQLEEELDTQCNNAKSLEDTWNSLNKDIDVLSDQLVSDDYESSMKNFEQLQNQIKEHDNLMSENQKTLEEKHKELECVNECWGQMQKVDKSWLDHIEEIDGLKEKLRDVESGKREVAEKDKLFTINNQTITDADKETQENIHQVKKTLSQKIERIKTYNEQIQAEMVMQRELAIEHQKLQEKCHISKDMCFKLEKEQEYFERECKEHYQRLLTCLSLVMTTCKSTGENLLQSYKK